jgi:hypothetical protein
VVASTPVAVPVTREEPEEIEQIQIDDNTEESEIDNMNNSDEQANSQKDGHQEDPNGVHPYQAEDNNVDSKPPRRSLRTRNKPSPEGPPGKKHKTQVSG